MRIAFISREYAGIGNGGGIGTYVRSAAQMLTERGHDVEVFTLGQPVNNPDQGSPRVHAQPADPADFARAIAQRFLAAHHRNPFDVIETAESRADAIEIFGQAPQIARIVKLHTAGFQIGAINDAYTTLASKARFLGGALIRGQTPKPFWGRYDAENDAERAMTLLADEITAPSQAIFDWTSRVWPIATMAQAVVPNVFVPSPALLAGHPGRRSKLVVFVGKLEVRKGVLELARAIPKILRKVPDARFRFVGSALPQPATGRMLDDVIRGLAGPSAAARIEFTGGIDYEEIAGHLNEAAIAVFPSYWENHPYVCLEAMASGCAVIGSRSGGIAEMIIDGDTGLLIPPKSPVAIARAVTRLLADPDASAAMAIRARAAVLAGWSSDVIGPQQEAAYERAIARSRLRNQ